MTDPDLKKSVMDANIAFHTATAATYETEQPHYLPENRALVSSRIADLAQKAGNETLVDLGCGAGFVLDLAVPFFQRLYGVDITPAMLSRVDLSSGKIVLHQASTESVPLNDQTANVITANSYLHHLYEIRPTISEAYRLLKPGGVFYSEEDPNVDYWDALKGLEPSAKEAYSGIVKRELTAVLDTHTMIEQDKGIDPKIVQMAEYQKMMVGGMREKELNTMLHEVGFSKVNIEYYWYMGQGIVMHQTDLHAPDIEAYLQMVLPFSKHLFKYLRIMAWK